jgi:hypothetical protein
MKTEAPLTIGPLTKAACRPPTTDNLAGNFTGECRESPRGREADTHKKRSSVGGKWKAMPVKDLSNSKSKVRQLSTRREVTEAIRRTKERHLRGLQPDVSSASALPLPYMPGIT